MQLASSSYFLPNKQILLGPTHVTSKSALIVFRLEYKLLHHNAVSGWRSIQQREVNYAGKGAEHPTAAQRATMSLTAKDRRWFFQEHCALFTSTYTDTIDIWREGKI